MYNGIQKLEGYRESFQKYTPEILSIRVIRTTRPQKVREYEIKSDKSDHIAVHKAEVLTPVKK